MLTLAPIFKDHAILQAEKPVRIFGTGSGTVKVSLGDEAVTCRAENGKWLAVFPPRAYHSTLDIRAEGDGTTVTAAACRFGDVYLFAGQSNMAYKVEATTPDGPVLETDDIRLFSGETVNHGDTFGPEDGWVPFRADTVPHFSAVAYYTVRSLYRKNPRPIGVISAHQGASVIESWLSPEALRELDIHLPKSDLFPDHYIEDYTWNKDSFLYQMNLAPILPYSLAGVIYYQGESNTGTGESKLYDRFLAKLVTSWRKGFANEELPFVIVQIANWFPEPPVDWHNPIGWQTVKERQAAACDALPFCSLAVSHDLCETNDIHPPTKYRLAARIADLLSK